MLLAEEDIYRVLLSNPDMIEQGFRVSSQQKGLGSGRADITGYDKEGRYTVVEVKRVPADAEAVKQAYKYISEMRETSPEVRGILVAPGLRPAARSLAGSLSIEWRQIDLKLCAELLSKEGSRGMDRLDRHLV